jgi:hypothetical protein
MWRPRRAKASRYLVVVVVLVGLLLLLLAGASVRTTRVQTATGGTRKPEEASRRRPDEEASRRRPDEDGFEKTDLDENDLVLTRVELEHPEIRKRAKNRRRALVVDCVLLNNELDLLQVRLESLWDVVDWFVLGESNYTFQNTPKPLHFANHRDRFRKYESKLVYVPILRAVAHHEYWETEVGARAPAEQALTRAADVSTQSIG